MALEEKGRLKSLFPFPRVAGREAQLCRRRRTAGHRPTSSRRPSGGTAAAHRARRHSSARAPGSGFARYDDRATVTRRAVGINRPSSMAIVVVFPVPFPPKRPTFCCAQHRAIDGVDRKGLAVALGQCLDPDRVHAGAISPRTASPKPSLRMQRLQIGRPRAPSPIRLIPFLMIAGGFLDSRLWPDTSDVAQIGPECCLPWLP